MSIKEINPNDLNDKIQSGQKIVLLDVREPFEHDLVNINNTHALIPLGELEDRIPEIEELKNEEVVVYCRSGARSAKACQILMNNGFNNVTNLQGGINKWSILIEPSNPIY